ncbi:MAG TPA: condensation domain-containing protein [Pseudonocardiaceae bacterium]
MSEQLTAGQQTMWQAEQDQPGRKDCLVAGLIRIRGPLDLGALDHALTSVIERHETLRSGFADGGGTPRRFVVAAGPPTVLDVVDLRPHGTFEQAVRLAGEHGATAFDLTAPPLLRAAVWRHADDEYVLSLALHHMITDGASTGIVVRELIELYNARVLGRAPRLVEPVGQFGEFVDRQAEWLATNQADSQLTAMLGELTGLRSSHFTPSADAAPDAVPGRDHVVHLPGPLTARVRELTRSLRSTPFMLLTAMSYVLLQAYTGDDDITVSSATANRTRVDEESMVGFLTQRILLRQRLTGTMSVRELLAEVTDQVLLGYERQRIPAEVVMRRLADAGTPQENLRPTVMVCVDNMADVAWAMTGVTATPLTREWIVPKRPLSLFLQESDGTARIRFVYRTDLFGPDTVRSMGEVYLALVEHAVDRPAASVAELLGAVALPGHWPLVPPPRPLVRAESTSVSSSTTKEGI